MRYGIREICEVVLRAKGKMTLGNKTFYKNDPVIYFDTLKTSSLEGAATTVYATGGRGNARLIAWEGERTLTFNFQDALISTESLAILSGAGLVEATADAPLYVHTTSQVVAKADGTITLEDIDMLAWNGGAGTDAPTGSNTTPYAYNAGADIFCMVLDDNGQITGEPCVPSAVTKVDQTNNWTITCNGHGNLKNGSIVLVDYYVQKTSGVQQLEITADKFAGNYYLEASTLFRDEATGMDMPAEFVIPNGKIQSNFTFSMAATGDPSVFDFVMDAFPDYTKFDRTKKVLCAIQVITEGAVGEDETYRPACSTDTANA